MSESKNKITPRQERFCQEYIIDLNGTQAAIRAGYSAKTAAQQAFDLLRKPNIDARIKELKADRSERTKVTQDQVINELRRIAFSDMRRFVKWNDVKVTLEDSLKLSDDDAACVAMVSQNTTKDGGGSISFKLHDKNDALELLARHLGILKDKLDLTTKDKELKSQPQIIVTDQATSDILKKVINGERANVDENNERILPES